MNKRKVLYLSYINDGVYHIYKFSNYGTYKIMLIDAGIAFNTRGGNYTDKYKKQIIKYNLDEFENVGTHYCSRTKLEFLESIYLNNEVGATKIPVPKLAYELLIEHVLPYMKRKSDEEERKIKRNLIINDDTKKLIQNILNQLEKK